MVIEIKIIFYFSYYKESWKQMTLKTELIYQLRKIAFLRKIIKTYKVSSKEQLNLQTAINEDHNNCNNNWKN